jgi:hypothetical protein
VTVIHAGCTLARRALAAKPADVAVAADGSDAGLHPRPVARKRPVDGELAAAVEVVELLLLVQLSLDCWPGEQVPSFSSLLSDLIPVVRPGNIPRQRPSPNAPAFRPERVQRVFRTPLNSTLCPVVSGPGDRASLLELDAPCG